LTGAWVRPTQFVSSKNRHFPRHYPSKTERPQDSADQNWKIDPAEFRIYLEYSYPRDLWNKMGVKAESNVSKRDVIVEMLGSHGFETPKLTSLKQVADFNGFFI
jgi:hypothetical protein